ncbi:MAG: GGDEF domain-containing protein [Lachnospiraceae bacterium]|nr:GGDEF domain-containing protein [Lachnospiraceae bacterium]
MELQSYAPEIRALWQKYDYLVGRFDPRAAGVLQSLRREAVRLGDDLMLGRTYRCLAFVEYFVKGNYDAFLRHLRKAALRLVRCDDPTELAHVYYLIAIDAINQRMYDIAFSDFLTARNLFARAGEENSVAVLDLNLGHLMMQLDDFRRARIYMRKALRVIIKHPEHPHRFSNISSIYMNDAACCLELHMTGKAAAAYSRAADFISAHDGQLWPEANFELALLGARLSLARNDKAGLKEHFTAVTTQIPTLAQPANQMTALHRFSGELTEAGEHLLTGELLRTLDRRHLPSDAAHAQLTLNDMKIDYYIAVKDRRKLSAAYRQQYELQIGLIERQQRAFLHAHNLIHLVSDLRKEQQAAQNERDLLLQLAKTDTLTGLPNRAALEEHLDQAFENAWKTGSSLGVSFIDFDELKTYNDKYGHAEGDRRLKEFGAILKSVCTDSRIYAARYGGDEFVVIYEGMTNAEISRAARALAAKSPLRISQGIRNKIPADIDRIWDYLSLADSSMYAAKKAAKKNPRSSGIRFNRARGS